MATKPKVGGAKKRAVKTPIPKAKEKSQRERFIKAARDVGVDESGREFERALKKLIPSRR